MRLILIDDTYLIDIDEFYAFEIATTLENEKGAYVLHMHRKENREMFVLRLTKPTREKTVELLKFVQSPVESTFCSVETEKPTEP